MKNIAAAFVKAQRDFAPALKTNTNPHFRSKYVGLDGCIEAVIDSLNNNGIALLQPTHECADGVTVETLFIHESGETMSGGKFHVPASKNDAQGYGSALTYARRYSLMAACGIAPEDDDGNAASKPAPAAAKPVAKPAPKPEPKAEQIAGTPGKWQISIKTEPDCTDKDYINIATEATLIALDQAKSQSDVMELYKVNKVVFDKFKSISADDHKDLMAAFTQKKESFK